MIRDAIATAESGGVQVTEVWAKLGHTNLAIFKATGDIRKTPLHQSLAQLGYTEVKNAGGLAWIWTKPAK